MMGLGIRDGLRRGLVTGLRALADVLRDEDVVADGPVSGATLAAPVAPAAVAPPAVLRAEPPPVEATPAPPPPGPAAEGAVDREAVIAVLHTIYDPEIPVDIYELGLIYDVAVGQDRGVDIRMTLTSPNCPAAQSLPDQVKHKVSNLPGVDRAEVTVVFDPPWTPDLMSEEARLELNL